MTAGPEMDSPHRRVRLAAGALAAAFALPSCFTLALWREPDHLPKGNRKAAESALAVRDDPQAQLLVRLPNDGPWLRVAAREHADMVARLLREDRACCLQLLAESKEAPPRVWLHFDVTKLPAEDPVNSLDGAGRHHSGLAPYQPWSPVREWVVECSTEPIATPPDATLRQLPAYMCTAGTSTLGRIAGTPFTVALDAVLLPIELLMLPAWWFS